MEKKKTKTSLQFYITKCSYLNTKLLQILDIMQAMYKKLEKEKKDGFQDPRILLAMSLWTLSSDITVWMNGYKGKFNPNKTACLCLAPASYKEQMAYISKISSEPNAASKLSKELKDNLSLLSRLFDELYEKDELEKINALNEAYANCLKGKK